MTNLPFNRRPYSPRDAAFLLLALLLCLALCLPLLLRFPVPGGDEPGFVDAAFTLLNKGYLGTELHMGLLPGFERHIYWQPPLYFVLLAGWIGTFGMGLAEVRSFSLVCALLVVAFTYLLARRHGSARTALLAACLCAVGYWLVARAGYARMDTLCVALTLASLLAVQAAEDRQRLALHALAGLLAGLALLTHPLGVIAVASCGLFLLLRYRLASWKTPALWALALPILACLAAWLAYILQELPAFKLQMNAQLARKGLPWSYWHHFRVAWSHAPYLLLMIGSGILLLRASLREPELRLPALAFALAFVAATAGHESGYFLYFQPLGCVAAALMLARLQRPRISALLLALVFATELLALAREGWGTRQRDYASVVTAVRAAIPPGKSVFISNAEPTPYFALAGRNPMRVIIPVPLQTPRLHATVAAKSDYIVASAPEPRVAEILEITLGMKPVAVIDQPGGYYVEVYRLH